jgi:hypothetical protein
MQFFKYLFFIIFLSTANATDIKETIVTKEMGSCASNNLSYSAMKFYKIPLNEKYEDLDLYLRIILFFNNNGALTLRLTTQALIGCQISSTGEQVCSYRPMKDSWIKSSFILDKDITIAGLGKIEWRDITNSNRGFTLTFAEDFSSIHLRGREFIGGMVAVNFDQNGLNTINICKQ